MSKTDSNSALIGKKMQVRLRAENEEVQQIRRLPAPQMPTITGTLRKKCLYYSWAYVIQLDEVLVLDRDGIAKEARKKISTSFLMLYLYRINYYEGKDPFYLEFNNQSKVLEKMNSRTKDGEILVRINHIDELVSVPSEITVDDRFLKKSPYVCDGWVKLLD